MPAQRYGAICPISHACKILEPRWTIHILTEMWAGSTHFNEIRRGVGSISPGLLSRRLKELETLGMIERRENASTRSVEYYRTSKAIRLEPSLNALGAWAQQNIAAEVALSETDVSALMWKLRRDICTDVFPDRRVIIRFHFSDPGLKRSLFWLVFYPHGERDLCVTAPRHDVDLYIETNLISFGGVLTGRTSLSREMDNGGLYTSGDAALSDTMRDWLPFSVYLEVGNIQQLHEVSSDNTQLSDGQPYSQLVSQRRTSNGASHP